MSRDLTGVRFGELVVLERAGVDDSGHRRWLCGCDCGRLAVRGGTHLIRAKREGRRSCCARCLNRLRDDMRGEVRDDLRLQFFEQWQETGSLWSPFQEDRLAAGIMSDLEDAFGDRREAPWIRPERVRVDPSWPYSRADVRASLERLAYRRRQDRYRKRRKADEERLRRERVERWERGRALILERRRAGLNALLTSENIADYSDADRAAIAEAMSHIARAEAGLRRMLDEEQGRRRA
jgi:hypothetical protein